MHEYEIVPDPIEIMEANADRMEETLEIFGDTFKCPACNQRRKLSTAVPTSPRPDAMPICQMCSEM